MRYRAHNLQVDKGEALEVQHQDVRERPYRDPLRVAVSNTFPGVTDTHPCVFNTHSGVSNTRAGVSKTGGKVSS